MVAATSMKPTPFYRWEYTDPDTGARRVTSYRMCEQDAQERFPGAKAIPDSLEWRNLPEDPTEWQSAGFPRRRAES